MDSSPYDEYSIIEKHIEFSKILFLLDKKGIHILNELNVKKTDHSCKDITKIYTVLVTILNVKKYQERLYLNLLSDLDELLFKEIKKYDKFYIDDDNYDLTSLYFNQSSWIKDQEIHEIKLYKNGRLDIHDAMYLICYLREYENILLNIETYTKDKYSDINLLKTIYFIRLKLKKIWDVLICIVENNICDEDGK